jgi:5-methylcytosine-specific restriction enzyme A
METYLITWNPARWKWDNLDETIGKVLKSDNVEDSWTTGRTTSIVRYSRLFLLKQGTGARGIMGAGYATSEVYEDLHYDPERRARGEKANCIDLVWETLLSPENQELLETEKLLDRISAVNWSPRAGGQQVDGAPAAKVEQLWREHLRQHGYPIRRNPPSK